MKRNNRPLLKYGEALLPDSSASPSIEGRPSEKISLEVQAGLVDVSGAIFIVLQI